MYFNIASYFYADLQPHFCEHGFHWGDESHMVDTASLTQIFQAYLHTEEGCGGPIGLHLTIRWHAETHVDFQEWTEKAKPGEPVPEEFVVPLEFYVCLPPLDNPPDLLSTWMELLDRFDDSPIRVDISAFDSLETPTDPVRRSMNITARADIPINALVIPEEELDHDDDAHFPACKVIMDLHDLCTLLEERMEQWCPVSQT